MKTDSRPLLVHGSAFAGPGALLSMTAWIIGIVATAAGMVWLAGPDPWLAALLKPTWMPPAWLFAPAWTAQYVLMVIGLWLVHTQHDADVAARHGATRLFLLQLALNLAWAPLFFGLHLPLLAFFDIFLLWSVILWTALAFGKIRALAG